MSDQNQQQPSGLPQSQLGGLHPELRARITAARAYVDDFRSRFEAWTNSQSDQRPDYLEDALRLSHELRSLLDTIERLSK